MNQPIIMISILLMILVIHIRGLRDIASKGQITALAFMLRNLEVINHDRRIDLRRKIDELYARIEAEGVDILYSSYFTTTKRFLDLPRRQELLMLINRMRKVHFEKGHFEKGHFEKGHFEKDIPTA